MLVSAYYRCAFATLLLTIVLMFPVSAHAVIGDYDVRLTHTSAPHWFETGRGPFIGTDMRVYSGIGTFQNADYGAWRLVVPGNGSLIVGGTVSATLTTPAAAMRGRILAGVGSAAPTVLYDGGGDGQVLRTISGAYDWIQIDLRSVDIVKTLRVSENSIVITAVSLTLRDSIAPIITPLILPNVATWYSAGACIPFMMRFGDQGGGLAGAVVRRDRTGEIVSSWTSTRIESTRPGPTQFDLADCIAPNKRDHGDSSYTVTTTDVGGRSTSTSFSVRADQTAPSISGGPGDTARLSGPTPPVEFVISDSGSGLASVHGFLDGGEVPVTFDGPRVRLATGRLSVGEHAVGVTATDGSGNSSSVSRRVTVIDEVPPALVLSSPDARGDATAFIDVRASDDHSGVDKATWRILLNGEPVASTSDASQATARIGPLAPGAHRIDVQVADASGNIGRLTHTYTAVSASTPAALNVGARSGIWVTEAPMPTLPYGTRAAVVTYLARNGRPMSNQTVQVRRDGLPVGSATSDADGIARVTFGVTAPGTYDAFIVGAALDPAPIELRVAPRIVLAALPRLVRVGRKVSISGRVFPGIRGRRVAVEARIGSAWYPIRRAASVGADGRFRSTVTPTTKGPVWIRVRMLAVGAWAPAVSNERPIRAR